VRRVLNALQFIAKYAANVLTPAYHIFGELIIGSSAHCRESVCGGRPATGYGYAYMDLLQMRTNRRYCGVKRSLNSEC